MFRKEYVKLKRVVMVDELQKENLDNNMLLCDGINDWDSFAYEDYAKHKIFLNGTLIFDNDNIHGNPEEFFNGVLASLEALGKDTIINKYVSWEDVGGHEFLAY